MSNSTSALRTRWAAIGAAVAVTLGAGVGSGVLTINAAPVNNESAVVAVDPVRIVDTRSGVGFSSAFVSGSERGLKVTGTVPTTGGDAQVVPQFATGVILNVTVVRPTSNGFLSVVPASAGSGPYPTSNLNFVAGANTPNAVTVALPGAGDYLSGDPRIGSLSIRFDGAPGATTHVLVDVVGYLTESVVLDHERRLNNLEATSPVLVAHDGASTKQLLGAGGAILATVEIPYQQVGDVIVNASVMTSTSAAATPGDARCSIVPTAAIDTDALMIQTVKDGESEVMSLTRGFRVSGSNTSESSDPLLTFTANLFCEVLVGAVVVSDPQLTATYVPIDPEIFAGG